MPVLVVCFVIFFGIAELYPLVEGITVPMPVFVVSGLLLAIASNYTKPAGLPWRVGNQSDDRSIERSHSTPAEHSTTQPIKPSTANTPISVGQPSTDSQSSTQPQPLHPLPPKLSRQPRKSPELPRFLR